MVERKSVSLAEYHHEYMQEIYARAGSEQTYYQSAFLDQIRENIYLTNHCDGGTFSASCRPK